MKILLTGSNGQVGKEITKISKKFKLDLISMDKAQLNIIDYAVLEKQIIKYQPEVIINAAAYTNVEKAEEQKVLAEGTNFHAVKNLAEICKNHSILLIHLSTDYVFNGLKKSDYLETDKTDPINTYGKTKLLGEEVIRSLLEEHIIIRTSWIFGIHGNNFVKNIIKLARKETELRVINNQWGSPTSAKSIAKAIFKIIENYSNNKDINFGTYHFSGTPATNWYDLARRTCDLAYKKGVLDDLPSIKPVPSSAFKTLANRPINSCLNSEKIHKFFGIKQDKWNNDLDEIIDSL